ncbi:MAG: PD-(D/E)XK nuclease family protein [Clostridia bacterium]|nr:PD-(D/E)XK nuclease family protein [Clostridia bacterium]
MVEIIYCRNDSIKTEYMLKTIKENTENGKRQLVFVPETKTFEMEKALLSMFESGGSRYVEAASMTRFAMGLTKNKELKFASNGAKLLMCKRAVDEAKSSYSYYTKGTENPSFYSRMLESIEEIMKSGVKAEELYSAYSGGGFKEDILDIAATYTVYEGELEKSGFALGDILTNGAEELCNLQEIPYDDIWFCGYTGFTHSERQLINELMKKNADLHFTFMTDGKDSLFLEQNRSIFSLERECADNGIKCKKIHLENNAQESDISFLAEKILAFGKEKYGKSENIRFLSGANINEECSYVASEIFRLTREKNLRYKDIVIACGNVEKYASAVERAMNGYKIPVYASDKTELLAKPSVAALTGAVFAVRSNFSYEAMFSFLKTGLLDIPEELVCKLENYVIAWNIRGSMWSREWHNTITEYGERQSDEKIAELKEINAVREKIMAPLTYLKDSFSTAEKGADYISAIRKYMEIIGFENLVETKAGEYYDKQMQREALEYVQLYDIIIDALSQFEQVAGEDVMNVNQFHSLLCLVLSGYSIATVPDTIDRVVLSDFRNTPILRPEVVFIIGCNDGDFPPDGAESSLISERDREELSRKNVQLSLTGEERQIEMESHIYRTLNLPKDKLYMSFSRADLLGNEQCPSYLMSRAQAIIDSVKLENITDKNEEYMLYTEDTAMLLASKYLSGESDDIVFSAFEHLKDKKQNQFESIENVKSGKRGPLVSRDTIRSLYGSRANLSASRIEKIKSCPFAYFMEYGMRAKERRRIDFDAKSVGSFMHELVENAVREYIEKGRDAIAPAIKASAESYISRVMHEGEMTAKLRVVLENIVKNSYDIIANIIDEIEQSDFRPMFCELSFGEGGVDGYSFERGGLTVNINGKIDRVDGFVKDGNLYLKVVDYKTGTKKFRISDIIYGLNIQMFLYMMMLNEIKNIGIEQNDARKAAAVMYIPLRTEYSEKKEPTARREGYVLDETNIIDALEHSKDGNFSYIPVKFKKDGSFAASSAVLSSAQFGNVFRKIKDHLNDIADMINTGHIEAEPYTHGEEMNACKYCPYGEACAFDESNMLDRMRKIKNLPDKTALAEMEEEA